MDLARLLLASLIICSPGAQLADAQTQGPIHLIFDMHCDPIPNGLSVPQKVAIYEERVANMNWVLDQTEPLGVEISYLSSGLFMELLVGGGSGGVGSVALRRLYNSGAQIASHSHSDYRAGVLQWPNLAPGATLEDERGVWQDNIDWVNQGILTAYGGTPPEALDLINNVRGSHVPSNEADYHTLMGEFGMTVREPGAEEDYYGWYSHHIWHPFRPSATNYMAEDFGTSFVQVTQGSVIGKAALHHGVFQDMTAGSVKRQFLQLYLNWRYADRTGQPEKVWSWGWGSHAHDFDLDQASRAALVDVLPWIDAHFASRVEPTGSRVMQWDTQRGTADAFLAWETAHPGVSSFSFDSLTVDWNEYPWLRPVAEELAGFLWSADISLGAGVEAFEFIEGGVKAVLVWRESGSSSVDVSALVGPDVRVVGLETGSLLGTDPTDVTVAQEPVLITERDAGCPTPMPYCTANPNSAGSRALIGASGSTSMTANDFGLVVTGGVPGKAGLFFYGPLQISAPFGNGVRCVGGGGLGIFRLAPVVNFDGAGAVGRSIDNTAPPADGGPGAFAAGRAWNFQLWYRDPAGGGVGFNLSDGLSVLFCP